MSQVIMLDIVVTKVTAKPIESAGLLSLETPIKEHNPKNLERIKLLINTIEIIMVMNLLTSIASYPLYFLMALAIGSQTTALWLVCLLFYMPVINQANQKPHCQ